MPQTHNDLKDWVIEKSKTKNYLLMTDVAKDVSEIIAGGPVPKHIKPIWPFISLLLSIHYQTSLKIFMELNQQK